MMDRYKPFFGVMPTFIFLLLSGFGESIKLRGLSFSSISEKTQQQQQQGRQLRMVSMQKARSFEYELWNTIPSLPPPQDESFTGKDSSSSSLTFKKFEPLPTTFDDDDDDNNGMDENFLETVVIAAKLSQMIQWDNITTSTTFVEFVEHSDNMKEDEIFIYYNNHDDSTSTSTTASSTIKVYTKVWIDEPDKAIVARVGNLCFGIFRATTPTREDWEQNFNSNENSICTTATLLLEDNEEACCTSREGFSNAYTNPEYRQDFETELRSCAVASSTAANTSNSNSNNQVILTGHSQGGGIAMVASVFLADLHPSTITFAQPAVIDDPCHVIDSSRTYRFVNTLLNNQDKLVYDLVPFIYAFGNTNDQQGHMFLLGPTNDDNDANPPSTTSTAIQVAYYPDNEVPSIGSTDWSFVQLQKVHSIQSYLFKLKLLLYQSRDAKTRTDSSVLPTDGWTIGSKCTLDSQCISPHICNDHRDECSNGQSGIDTCWNNNDCVSKRCEGWINPKCQDKLPPKSRCNEDSDCRNGTCKWNWRCN